MAVEEHLKGSSFHVLLNPEPLQKAMNGTPLLIFWPRIRDCRDQAIGLSAGANSHQLLTPKARATY